jgi:hypothetical protein
MYWMMLHWLAQPLIFISNNSRIFKKWKCSDHLRFSVHPEDTGKRQNTFMILAPSKRYLTCLPTISARYTTSPKIPSWTTVKSLGARALNSWTLLRWPHDPSSRNNNHILWKVKNTINSKYSNDLQQKRNTNYLAVVSKHLMWHQESTPCIS